MNLLGYINKFSPLFYLFTHHMSNDMTVCNANLPDHILYKLIETALFLACIYLGLFLTTTDNNGTRIN